MRLTTVTEVPISKQAEYCELDSARAKQLKALQVVCVEITRRSYHSQELEGALENDTHSESDSDSTEALERYARSYVLYRSIVRRLSELFEVALTPALKRSLEVWTYSRIHDKFRHLFDQSASE